MLSLPIQAATSTTTQTTHNASQPLSDVALHTVLIETAIRYDFYNKRCRGVSFDKHYDKVNRLFVTKYRLTVHNYVRRHLNQDIKVLKQTLEHQLNEQLNQLGSCQNAKDQGLVDDLQNQFNQLYQQAEKSPWFPE